MKIRILIVDETAFVRDALKRALRRFLKEVEIHDAINGNRALAVLRTNKINLIISDWDLPEMSGRELLDWVRSSDNFAKTPFIVSSDEGDRNLVMNAIQAGANDFMAKPFTPEEVQKKVTKQLARIGYKPRAQNASSQNTGFGSVDVLTSSSAKAAVMKPREVKSAAGFGKPAAAKTKKATAKPGSFDGAAHLHFKGYSTKCSIRELSLTTINGDIERDDQLPSLFDTAEANIENAKGEPIGKLKVYVHAMQASDPRPDASGIKVSLRFVDNSPEAFEQLSKAIANSR